MRNIKNVFVNGISLVSKNEAPAVEQAENKFALFKVRQKDYTSEILEIKKNINKFYIKQIKKNINVL